MTLLSMFTFRLFAESYYYWQGNRHAFGVELHLEWYEQKKGWEASKKDFESMCETCFENKFNSLVIQEKTFGVSVVCKVVYVALEDTFYAIEFSWTDEAQRGRILVARVDDDATAPETIYKRQFSSFDSCYEDYSRLCKKYKKML